MNNFEGWKHINTAPKDREVIVWDGEKRHVAKWFQRGEHWDCHGWPVYPTHWRGCPPPPGEEEDD